VSAALQDNVACVEIYRAKEVSTPRFESVRKIGTMIDAAALLVDLRNNVGVEPALGLPSGPGSGLSARIPELTDCGIPTASSGA